MPERGPLRVGSLEGLSRVQIPSSPLKMTEEAAVAIFLWIFFKFFCELRKPKKPEIKKIKKENLRIRENNREIEIERIEIEFK